MGKRALQEAPKKKDGILSLQRWGHNCLHLERDLINGANREELEQGRKLLRQGQLELFLALRLQSANTFISWLARQHLRELWREECGRAARLALEKGVEVFFLSYDMQTRLRRSKKKAPKKVSQIHRDMAEAERILTSLARIFPEWTEPLYELANIRFLQTRCGEAISLLTRVLQLKPFHYRAWKQLVIISLKCRNSRLMRIGHQALERLFPSERATREDLEPLKPTSN